MGTYTQNFNLWVLKFRGIQNLWVLKIYLYPKFGGLRFVGTPKNRGYSNLLDYIFKKLSILKIWGTIICGHSRFVGIQNL